jgi:hypothetical protein
MGSTPRMLHPSDLKTKTLQGAGEDWLFACYSIENAYSAVEVTLNILGSSCKQYSKSAKHLLKSHKIDASGKRLFERYPEN